MHAGHSVGRGDVLSVLVLPGFCQAKNVAITALTQCVGMYSPESSQRPTEHTDSMKMIPHGLDLSFFPPIKLANV